MDIEKFKEKIKLLSEAEKKELFQDLYNSIDIVRASIQNSMEPVYKAVEPLASAISNFNQSIIESFIVKSESFQNTINSMLNWFKNIDWQRVRETYEINSKFCDEVLNQLESKNLDSKILNDFNISQIAELYLVSDQCGLTFSDLIEDNMQLFGQFEYNKAQVYLDIIKKRKNQSINNDNSLNIDEGFVENLKYSEKNIAELVGLALREYEKSDIVLQEEDKKLLNTLKQNKFLKDKELARIFGCSTDEIATLCAKVRKEFNIDYFDDDNVKRSLLVNLAKNITIKS